MNGIHVFRNRENGSIECGERVKWEFHRELLLMYFKLLSITFPIQRMHFCGNRTMDNGARLIKGF